MTFGFQLLAWRRHRGLTQLQLASKAGISRPYLSRLEMDKVDPSLSLLRRLAVALSVGLGEFLEKAPTGKPLSNEELDLTARAALRPSSVSTPYGPYVRPLSRLLKERREALGLYKARGKSKMKKTPSARQSLRSIKADLGEAQWQALLKRVDKHAVYLAPKENEDK